VRGASPAEGSFPGTLGVAPGASWRMSKGHQYFSECGFGSTLQTASQATPASIAVK
jgi:hypothetical protein